MSEEQLKRNNGYGFIHWATFDEFKLKPDEAVLMALVESLSKKSGTCYASKHTLARMLNVSDATIFRYIGNLVEKNVLQRSKKLHQHGIRHLRPSPEWTSYTSDLKDARNQKYAWRKPREDREDED